MKLVKDVFVVAAAALLVAIVIYGLVRWPQTVTACCAVICTVLLLEISIKKFPPTP
jgi:hypothetical protein